MTFLYFPSGYLTIGIDDIYGQYHKYMEVKLDNKCILAIVMNKIYQETIQQCHNDKVEGFVREMPPTQFGHMTYIKTKYNNVKIQMQCKNIRAKLKTMNHAMWHDEHEHVMMMQCNGSQQQTSRTSSIQRFRILGCYNLYGYSRNITIIHGYI